MTPKPASPQAITTMASAYQRSTVLFVANDAGLFDVLVSPRSVEDVAGRLGWSVRGTRIFLDALVGLGFLRRDGYRYLNAPIAERHLTKDSPESLVCFLRHTRQCKERWDSLEESLRLGRGLRVGHHVPGTQEFYDYVGAMLEVGNIAAAEVLREVDLSPFRRMLDLACGAGQYSRAFLRACPSLHVTLFDLKEIVDIAARHVTELDRCHFIAGDCRVDDLGRGYDLVWISNLMHGLSPEEGEALVGRCFRALDPGGTLMVKDFIVNEEEQGPAFSLLFSLHMYLHTHGGRVYTSGEMRDWARKAGFANPTIADLGPSARLLTVTKPR